MVLTLISATPSPYARKVRIVLAEADIPFTLQTVVPWDSTSHVSTATNPLGKIPILVLEDGTGIYESRYILEYIEAKFLDGGTSSMLSSDVDERLFARKIEVVADGMCDACVLMFFEKQRQAPSEEWKARQMRKLDGGMAVLAGWVGEAGREFVVGGKFGLGDVAIGSLLGYLDVRFAEYPWRTRYPKLAKYFDGLARRQSFVDTAPVPQNITEKIV